MEVMDTVWWLSARRHFGFGVGSVREVGMLD